MNTTASTGGEDKGMIADLGLGGLPIEERVKLLEESSEAVLKRVLARLIDTLPAEKFGELNAIAEKTGGIEGVKKAIEYLLKNAPEVASVIEEEVRDFREEARAIAAEAENPDAALAALDEEEGEG